MKKYDEEIVSGGIFRSMWKVAWPVILTQVIGGVHGIIDQALVGKYVGYAAQAAIGTSWQLFLVVVVFLSSLFTGMYILISQYIGRQDSAAVNHVAHQTLLASLYILVLVISPLGYLATPVLLDLVGASPEVREHAVPYLRVLFVFNAPLFLMFLLVGVMQSSGNMKIPLFLGISTCVTHLAASYVLIRGVGPFPELGSTGAAIGDVFGPVPSVGICLWLIYSGRAFVGPPEKFTLRPDFPVLWRIAKLGVPSGIQAVLLNIGGACLIYFINRLPQSAEALAAYTVCYSQLFSIVTWTGFGLRAACATVIGQNIGAGKPDRGARAVYFGAGIGAVWATVFGILYWAIPDILLGIFSIHDEVVSSIARNLLHFLAFSGVCVVVTLAFTGGLQGAGDTKKPMYIALVTQIFILLGICTFYTAMGWLSATAIWSAILISHASRLSLTLFSFASGKWRSIKVDMGERGGPATAEVAAAGDVVPGA